jgi:hypothetical protein
MFFPLHLSFGPSVSRSYPSHRALSPSSLFTGYVRELLFQFEIWMRQEFGKHSENQDKNDKFLY